VTRLYPQALGSLFVASYDTQGYGGDIRTRLHRGLAWVPHYIVSGRTQQKTQFPNNLIIVACVFVAAGRCLPSRSLAMNVYSYSTIPAFMRHVTIFMRFA
jgi:hypothetical protein